jgi:cyanophycin synthetase
VIDHLFDAEDDGRIPVVAVTGVNGKTTVARFIAHLAMESGYKAGSTCTDGIYVGLRRIQAGDCSGPASAHAILSHPDIDFAVLETARGGILRAGLAFDRCDVAVVTNIGSGDHLGVFDVDNVEKLARVKQTVVEAVKPGGWAVLNAADPLVAAMGDHCDGRVVYFALDEANPVIAGHREGGGRAVFVRDDEVILADGHDSQEVLIRVADVPLSAGGRIGFQVENLLAAVGAAWVLNFDLDIVRAGVQSFASDTYMVPGRFNLFEIGGATVLVDYGHNVSALQALTDALRTFPHERRVAVYSAAGDRRDEDMIEQGRILGRSFDEVYLYEDQYRRGRAEGEIMDLIEFGIREGGNREKSVRKIRGALAATEAALAAIQPGDLLLIQPDTVDETMRMMRRVLESRKVGREVDLDGAIATAEGEFAVVGGVSSENSD